MQRMLLLILILPLILFAEEKITIAVNELTGHGVSENDTKIITERLRSEMINTKHFRVMERSEMDAILQEQGFQTSGACDDGSCLLEVGQLLGVKQIMSGSVGLIGGLYTLNLKTVEVESAEIISSVSVDFEGKITGLLSQGVKEAVLKLETAIAQKHSKDNSATITISTEPSNALITINGQSAGYTPLQKHILPAGDVTLSIVKRDYTSFDTTLTIDPGADQTLHFTLLENEKEKSKRRRIIGLTTGGTLTAAGALSAVFFNNELSRQQDEYDVLVRAPQKDYDAYRSNMNKSHTLRNTSYGIAGVGLGLLTFSFFF